MHAPTLLSLVLCALVALATADSHVHRVNHRGMHRRHHARAQDGSAAAVSAHKRRSCPAGSSSAASTDSAASSTASATSSSAAAASTISTSASAARTDRGRTDDTPASTGTPAATRRTDDTRGTAALAVSSSTAVAASTTASSSAAAASSAAPHQAASAASSLLSALFPVSDALASWSTAAGSSARSTALELSDSTLRTTRVLSGTTHAYVTWEGKSAMQAHYPKGSYNFQHTPRGGFSWYAYGPAAVDLTTAKEATLGYSVYFENGFEYVLGGKLPGFYGGNSDDGAISCSGGARSDDCFSARMMWRPNAAGELYTYLPPSFSANDAVCNVAPYSDCNPTYGASVGRGAFSLPAGQWHTVAVRTLLNDAGKTNGEIEIFVNGQSVISTKGLVLRNSDAGRIRGIMGQTFFGGSTSAWASPKDQNAYFADFSVAITKKL